MKKIILISVLLLFALIACEDVIDLDLDEEEGKLVIEGKIYSDNRPIYVKLSQSTNIYDPQPFPAIEDAQLLLETSDGQSTNLEYLQDGIYETKSIDIKSGINYTLKVEWQGEEYEATTYMPFPSGIDSTVLFLEEGSSFVDDGYYGFFYGQEGSEDENYHILRYYKKGFAGLDTLDQDYFLGQQFYANGQVQLPMYVFQLKEGDIGLLEYMAVDEQVFEYLTTLEDIAGFSGGGPFDPVPQNPSSNFSNGALGYFGAFAITYDTLPGPQ